MKTIFKTAFNLIIKPKSTWQHIFKLKISKVDLFLNYGLTFALIGPVLSFYSLYIEENYPIKKVLTYSLTTYVLDLLSVLILASFLFFIFILFKNYKNFDSAFKLSLFIYIPIWLSDIVDIYQPLRILSNVGLIYSLYLLYLGLKIIFDIKISMKKDFIFFIFICSIHLILYILDALFSEIIVTNPVLKEFLNHL